MKASTKTFGITRPTSRLLAPKWKLNSRSGEPNRRDIIPSHKISLALATLRRTAALAARVAVLCVDLYSLHDAELQKVHFVADFDRFAPLPHSALGKFGDVATNGSRKSVN